MAHKLRVAVVGGGINGLCCAWLLAQHGHQVQLYEKGEVMQQTSAASSKLLHGGLRYLENLEFRLVKEALQERQWWLSKAPLHTRRLPILYPLYAHSRPRLLLKFGLMLYDSLAGRKGIGRHRWLTPQQLQRCSPQLMTSGLKGAYLFFDGQMDDVALGQWVASKCRKLGVGIHEHTPVVRVGDDGHLALHGEMLSFDRVINVAGPWSASLLQQSGLAVQQPLDLVRGSHLLLSRPTRYGHMLEVPGEKRLVFVLPYQGKTLLGTTEVRQTIEQPIQCSMEEKNYLLNLYNHYFSPAVSNLEIVGEFAGLRPLLAGSDQPSRASREYRLDWQGKLLTVSGGKWTTARALARAVLEKIELSVRR